EMIRHVRTSARLSSFITSLGWSLETFAVYAQHGWDIMTSSRPGGIIGDCEYCHAWLGVCGGILLAGPRQRERPTCGGQLLTFPQASDGVRRSVGDPRKHDEDGSADRTRRYRPLRDRAPK